MPQAKHPDLDAILKQENKVIGTACLYVFIALYFLLTPSYKEDYVSLCFFEIPSFNIVLWGFLTGLLSIVFNKFVNDELNRRGLNRVSRPIWHIAPMIALIFYAPLAEEVIFRGHLQVAYGLPIACLIFAAAHIGPYSIWNVIVSKLPTGLILGAGLLFTGNIWVSIIAHVLNNAWFILQQNKTSELVIRALKARFDNNPNEAEQLLTEALKKQETVYALRNRANIYSELKRYDDAIKDASRAIELHDRWSYILRANIYASKGEIAAASADIAKGIQYYPNDPHAHRIAASIALEKGDLNEALKETKVTYSISREPLDLVGCARINLLLDNYDICLSEVRDVLILAPKCEYALIYKADAYTCLGQYNQAIEIYDQVLEIAKDAILASTYSYKATTLFRIGRKEEAFELSEKAIKLSPNEYSPLLCWAFIQAQNGHFDEAHVALEKANAVSNTRLKRAFLKREGAAVAILQQLPETALDRAAEAAELHPNLARMESILGLALLKAGKPDQAIAKLSQVIKMHKLHSDSYWFRHLAYKATDQPEAAAADKRVLDERGYMPWLS